MATDFRDVLALVEAMLRQAPALDRIARPAPAGDVAAQFVLPLELCQSQNRTRHGRTWEHARIKLAILDIMRGQFVAQYGKPSAPAPLQGRPQVRAIRFSRREPDRFSNWAKSPIDALCSPTARSPYRLGLLRDDSPANCDEHQWWEPTTRSLGSGFVFLEVRKGEPS